MQCTTACKFQTQVNELMNETGYIFDETQSKAKKPSKIQSSIHIILCIDND